MALDLTPEQKDIGRKNFAQAAGELARMEGPVQSRDKPTRRTFMGSLAAGAAVVPLSSAVYFGYDSWKGNKALRTAFIGVGDEGGVLIGEHNPEFVEIVAIADVRPYNRERALTGEPSGPRKGLNKIYGTDTAKQIQQFAHWEELLEPGVIAKLGLEAVVIALPLHLHHDCTVKCMKAGLHVLCEKLMARTITQCKSMTQAAQKFGKVLNVGHQRHYSMLYAHATEVVNAGILGDIKHIRALWHRNNSWPFTADDKTRETFATGKDVDGQPFDVPFYKDGWYKPVLKSDEAALLKDPALLKKYGYDTLRELVRWRVYDRTGGGLMAELGSHQLDASSIFLGKVHPLAVQGVGGKFFYGPGRNDRQGDDGVFVTYEFPGKNHPQGANKGSDKDDIVVVTYSSFNTNSFEEYGECLMGSRGTMIVEREADVYLFREKGPGGPADAGGKSTEIKVTQDKAGKPVTEASSSWGGAAGSAVTKAAGAGAWDTNVRGYRTEMEHFAFCVRAWGKDKVDYTKGPDGKMREAARLPRCPGEVAMADAILALGANMAMDKRVRIEFDPKWFDASAPDVPETKYGKTGVA